MRIELGERRRVERLRLPEHPAEARHVRTEAGIGRKRSVNDRCADPTPCDTQPVAGRRDAVAMTAGVEARELGRRRTLPNPRVEIGECAGQDCILTSCIERLGATQQPAAGPGRVELRQLGRTVPEI